MKKRHIGKSIFTKEFKFRKGCTQIANSIHEKTHVFLQNDSIDHEKRSQEKFKSKRTRGEMCNRKAIQKRDNQRPK